MATYCDFVKNLPLTDLHRIYHDTAYGFSINSDDELFERLILEINQAGLSWTTILKKQQQFRVAYDQFSIQTVASYGEKEKKRLLADAGIIRNRLKIDAAIYNATVILRLQKEHGSFKQWLDMHNNLSKEEWVRLFKKTFHFTGGEIVNEFLMSTGYLPGAHAKTCPVSRYING
jgi:DNA-3-methyladenine glycosylase I